MHGRRARLPPHLDPRAIKAAMRLSVFLPSLRIMWVLRTGSWRTSLLILSLFTSQEPRSAAEQSKEGRWIRGHGWADDLWRATPHRSWLDRACPHHPVFLTRRDNHMAIINSKAGSPSPYVQQLVRQTLAGRQSSRALPRQSSALGMCTGHGRDGAPSQSRGAWASMLSGRSSWPARATDMRAGAKQSQAAQVHDQALPD